MNSAMKLTSVLLLALVITGCSSQSDTQRAAAGSVSAARNMVKTFFAAETDAFAASPGKGFDYIVAHGFPGFRTFQQQTACRDKWLASGQIIYFKPDLGTVRVDNTYGIPRKIGGVWRYGQRKPPGITYAVYAELTTKDNTHQMLYQGSGDFHFTVWNDNLYSWNLICG